MTIGLMGGSFDPAHSGHAHLAGTALKRLGLDAVWWLVTPQNPLKAESAPLAARMASATRVARGRRQVVTDIEARLGVQFTADTVRALQARYRGVAFVLVMGADGMASFARWRRWREIKARTPLLVLSRPGYGAQARMAKPFSPRARRQADRLLARARPPAWAFLATRLNPTSSTLLRRLMARR